MIGYLIHYQDGQAGCWKVDIDGEESKLYPGTIMPNVNFKTLIARMEVIEQLHPPEPVPAPKVATFALLASSELVITPEAAEKALNAWRSREIMFQQDQVKLHSDDIVRLRKQLQVSKNGRDHATVRLAYLVDPIILGLKCPVCNAKPGKPHDDFWHNYDAYDTSDDYEQ